MKAGDMLSGSPEGHNKSADPFDGLTDGGDDGIGHSLVPISARDAAVSFDPDDYHAMSVQGDHWRDATINTRNLQGAREFRAAGSGSDGSIIAKIDRSGQGHRVGSLLIRADGHWRTTIFDRAARDGIRINTEAGGQLRHRDIPTTLRRTAVSSDGTLLWTADAQTAYVLTEDGLRPRRVTSGTVTYADGGTSTFNSTVVAFNPALVATVVQSGGKWNPPPPSQPYTVTGGIVINSDGTTTWTEKVKYPNGDSENTVRHWGPLAPTPDGHTHNFKEVSVTKTVGGVTTSANSRETVEGSGAGPGPPQWSWHNVTTDGNGGVTEQDGVEVHGSDGTGSVSTSTKNSDGSVTIRTTTWDDNDGNRGTEHTVTTKGDDVLQDETKSGTVHVGGNNTFKRAGDLGPIFTPDDPDTGRTTQGGDDQSGDGHQDSGTAAADSDDPDGFGADTGGYPGLNWDGGNDGPLGLLTALAAAAIGAYDDPANDLEGLGDNTAVGALVAKAFRDAAALGGGLDGLGEDTGDPGHGLSQAALDAAKAVPVPDTEWGDWTNPKAHAHYGIGVDSAISAAGGHAPTVAAGSAVGFFLDT